MNLRQLEVFLAIADAGNSVTRAAETLHVAQPAASRTLADLEYDLGAPLFERTGRSLRLTAAGERFVGEARRLVEGFREVELGMRTGADMLPLRVGATYTVGTTYLARLLAARAALPGRCPVLVTVRNTHLIEAALVDGTRPPADWSPIPIGEPNVAYAKYFTGRSYLHKLVLEGVPAFGVAFEPGCRNNWHIHHAETGGGQTLICTAGRGYVQFRGEPAREMKPGDTVNIPAGVKHWHGAAPDSWFQHLALEVPGTEGRNEWLEPVDDAAYAKATGTAAP